jgi:hypothetical protein
MPAPETPGPLETGDGPRCPNCAVPVRADMRVCANCGAAMPPLPTLEGMPEEGPYLTRSRTGDLTLGALTAVLTPVVFLGITIFAAWVSDAMVGIGPILLLVIIGSFVTGPILLQGAIRPRYPWFAKGHGIAWKVIGVLFVLLILGLFALCFSMMNGPH